MSLCVSLRVFHRTVVYISMHKPILSLMSISIGIASKLQISIFSTNTVLKKIEINSTSLILSIYYHQNINKMSKYSTENTIKFLSSQNGLLTCAFANGAVYTLGKLLKPSAEFGGESPLVEAPIRSFISAGFSGCITSAGAWLADEFLLPSSLRGYLSAALLGTSAVYVARVLK